jgi:flagellar hook protein FlgE
MAFQQGLSGLDASSTQLDVIGNNIANSSTVGFKASQAQFADIYANSLNSVSSNTAGIGVSTSTIAQSFTEGSLTTSQNPLDIAISGAGFFRTVANGQVQYSRNGQFQVDKNGFLINAQLANVTGYNAVNGKVVAGPPVPIQIDPSDMKPNATTLADLTVNLSSTDSMPTTVPFNAQNASSYNQTSATTVYDSLGNASTLNTYYVKTGENTWDVYTGVNNQEVTSATAAAASQTDGASVADRAAYQAAVTTVPVDPAAISAAAQQYAIDAGTAVLNAAIAAGASQSQQDAITASFSSASAIATQAGQTPDQIDAAISASVNVPAVKTASLIFNSDGSLDTTAMLALTPPESMPLSVTIPELPGTGATNPLTFNLDLTGTTQYATSFGVKSNTQDGYAGGSLTTFTTDTQGIIQGQYSNGKTRELGQVVLANFTDPNGLDPVGGNAWVETNASGQPLIGTPNSGTLGKLLSNTTESSNTDLTTELVNMITAQRAYQANAQTIKTEDQILQTLVNLR